MRCKYYLASILLQSMCMSWAFLWNFNCFIMVFTE